MTVKTLNIVLGSILGIVVILSFSATRDFSRPNLEIMPDMYHGPTYRAFEDNDNTPDRRTLLDPANGSIPRGLKPFHYDRTEDDAIRAGKELTNPQSPDDPNVLARGATVYAVFCQHCHGPGGAGDGMVAKRGFPPPPSLLLEHAINMKDGQMYHVITLGQGNMPAHAAQVSRVDRWNVIHFIRSLQADARRKGAPSTPAQPVSEKMEGGQGL